MAWFGERSLRGQWRFAQAVLAIPVSSLAVWLIVVVGGLLTKPSWSVAVVQSLLPWGWVGVAAPGVLCAIGIEGIERHLAKPSPPAAGAPAA